MFIKIDLELDPNLGRSRTAQKGYFEPLRFCRVGLHTKKNGRNSDNKTLFSVYFRRGGEVAARRSLCPHLHSEGAQVSSMIVRVADPRPFDRIRIPTFFSPLHHPKKISSCLGVRWSVQYGMRKLALLAPINQSIPRFAGEVPYRIKGY